MTPTIISKCLLRWKINSRVKKNKFLDHSVTCVPHRYSDKMYAIKWILSLLAIRIKTLFPLTDVLSYVFTLDARLQTWPIAKCCFPILVLFVFCFLFQHKSFARIVCLKGFYLGIQCMSYLFCPRQGFLFPEK